MFSFFEPERKRSSRRRYAEPDDLDEPNRIQQLERELEHESGTIAHSSRARTMIQQKPVFLVTLKNRLPGDLEGSSDLEAFSRAPKESLSGAGGVARRKKCK